MKKIVSILVVIILGTIGWIKYSSLNHQASMDSAMHKEIWYCPMHPNYTSDRAGKCPICSMDLVNKKMDGAAKEQDSAIKGYAPVTLDLHQQQLIGIRTVKVVRQPITKIIRVSGYVAHDIELYEAQLAYVNAWHQYYAFRSRRNIADEYRRDWREYDIKETGRPKSSDLRNAQLRLLKAEYELQHMGITEDELMQLRQVKYGRVWVDPQLLYFHEGQSMWVYADMREDDIGYVEVGQHARVDVPNLNKSFEGVVRSVAKSVDIVTRTIRVRIELLHVPTELAVNMLVNVNIESVLNEAVQVPVGAVIDTGIKQVAFVAQGEGKFIPTAVTIGDYANGMVIIKEGLVEGQDVVLDGSFMVDSESRLHASMDSPVEEHHHE